LVFQGPRHGDLNMVYSGNSERQEYLQPSLASPARGC
jgi:hypothetical protein